MSKPPPPIPVDGLCKKCRELRWDIPQERLELVGYLKGSNSLFGSTIAEEHLELIGYPLINDHKSLLRWDITKQSLELVGFPLIDYHKSLLRWDINQQSLKPAGYPRIDDNKSPFQWGINQQSLKLAEFPRIDHYKSTLRWDITKQSLELVGLPLIDHHKSSLRWDINQQSLGLAGYPLIDDPKSTMRWDITQQSLKPVGYPRIDHHKSLGELRKSAKTECRACQIFWLYIMAETKAKVDDDFRLQFAWQSKSVQITIENWSQSFTHWERERTSEDIRMELSQFALGNQARGDSGDVQFSGGQESMPRPNHTTGETSTLNKKFVANIQVYSDDTVEILSDYIPYDDLDLENIMQSVVNPWVDDCVKNHHGCQEVQHLGFESCAPTRLIDVGTTHKDTVKLVDSGGLSKPRYLIFSYCWGTSNDRSKTTRANIEQRRGSILIAALPESIRDAIAVTKLMGVRYLWVDAICIIQEDKENNDGFLDDWKSEAAKMASYYSNALCCISNLSAADSSEGFLQDKQAVRRQGDRQGTLTQRRTGVEHFKYQGHNFDIPLPRRIESWLKEWEGSPLMRRAWALQEWILSRRILHCTKVGMFMECSRGVCQINDPFTAPGAVWHRTRGNEFSSILRESTESQICELWTKLVAFYSTMNLTNPTDRLIAIDGIARLICAKYNIGYFAGVLSSHVAQTLLWKRAEPRDEVDSDAIFSYHQLFPSWSWSSKQNVGFPEFDKCTSYVSCIDDRCFVLSDKVGNYADPSTRLFPLRGPILPFPVIYYPKSPLSGTYFHIGRNNPLWGGDPITIYMDSTKERTKLEKLATDRKKKLIPQWRLLVCLRNLTDRFRRYGIYEPSYFGLIVENLKDIGNNAYRRIGCFKVDAGKPEERNLNLEEWMTDINLY